MNKKILAITGRKQSGKDTLGNFLVSNATELFGPDFVVRKFGFADPLKDMVSELFRVPLAWLYGTDEDKNRPTTIQWGDLPHFNWDNNEMIAKVEKCLTVRELLQQFGTEVVRRMDGDAWVNALYRKIARSECSLAVIIDARFPNEVNAVKEWGGKVVRLTRNHDVVAEHESERALDADRFGRGEFDAILNNIDLTPGQQSRELVFLLAKWGWLHYWGDGRSSDVPRSE